MKYKPCFLNINSGLNAGLEQKNETNVASSKQPSWPFSRANLNLQVTGTSKLSPLDIFTFMTSYLNLPCKASFSGSFQTFNSSQKFEFKGTISHHAWSFSLGDRTLMMTRPKSLLLKASTSDLASDDEELDEEELADNFTFISPAQQWIDKACEQSKLTCHVFLPTKDRSLHNRGASSKAIMLLWLERLVNKVDKLLTWLHWLYDFT